MPRATRSWGPQLALVAVLTGLVLAAAMLWNGEARRGRSYPEYSVRRTDELGAAVVFRLYERAGLRPRVWERSLSRLEERGMLVLMLNRSSSLGALLGMRDARVLPPEAEALDAWVRRGNVAVIMAAGENALFEYLGLRVSADESVSLEAAAPAHPSVLADGVEELLTETPYGFTVGRQRSEAAPAAEAAPTAALPALESEDWLWLFERDTETGAAPQVLLAARGDGLYVAVNDVYPAGNAGMMRADNARFMLNLARLAPPGGTIWFDEYHKQEASRGKIAYVRDRALVPPLLYALALLLLAAWRAGFRFGEPDPLVADRRRERVEYVSAVAALYRNAGLAREALSAIHEDFRRRLLGALRADGMTDLAELGRRYEARTGRPAMEARDALLQAEAALRDEYLEEGRALEASLQLTRVDRALYGGTVEPPRAAAEDGER